MARKSGGREGGVLRVWSGEKSRKYCGGNVVGSVSGWGRGSDGDHPASLGETTKGGKGEQRTVKGR